MSQGRISALGWIAFKTAVFTILAPGAVTVLIPFALIHSQLAAWHFHCAAIQLAGGLAIFLGMLLGGWCMLGFVFVGRGTPAPIDPPKNLVISGPYRHVRNPMYVAVTIIILGEAVFFGSRGLLLHATICFIAFNLFVVLYEEPALRRKFGSDYTAYCRNVSRWIPKWPGFSKARAERKAE